MHATRFEYRFRLPIQVLIFLVGFFAVPLLRMFVPGLTDALGLSTHTTWLVLASMLARTQLLTFTAATMVLLSLAIVFTGLGAQMRVWGAAYLGSSVSQAQRGEALLADGPFRRTRNPLYLGTLLHTVGIAVLMPPVGAMFVIALIWVFQIRLALAEEIFLQEQFGPAYLEYKARVPRFLPSPTALVASAGAKPQWVQAVLGELYVIGAFVTLAVLGWNFNATPLMRGLLISLGLDLIVRAFLPKAAQIPDTSAA